MSMEKFGGLLGRNSGGAGDSIKQFAALRKNVQEDIAAAGCAPVYLRPDTSTVGAGQYAQHVLGWGSLVLPARQLLAP